jgi:hypothetical protein
MNDDEKELIIKTLEDLVRPAFQLISDYLLSRKFQPEWSKGTEEHVVKFTDRNGKACEFSARVDMRLKSETDTKRFPCVIINYHKGNFITDNTGCDPANELTPDRIFRLFKNTFGPLHI